MTANEQGQEDLTPKARDVGRGEGMGGPFSLGDPEDRTLRKVEISNLVNKRKMYLVDELCLYTATALRECMSSNQLTGVVRCRSQLNKSRECAKYWIDDERVKQITLEDYLDDRTRFRKTGIQNFTSKGDQEKGLRARAVKFAAKIRAENTNDPF